MLLNETGNGTICIPKWTLPADLGIVDGMDASLQVITIGDSGTALYNVSQSINPVLCSILSIGFQYALQLVRQTWEGACRD